MSMMRWNPWREMEAMREVADQMARNGGIQPRSLILPVDALETEDAIVVTASVPGLNPEDIQISVEDNVLTIRGEFKREQQQEKENWVLRERAHGRFERSLRLTIPVDINNAEAVFNNGVLTLSLPKAPEAKPFAIRVKQAGSQE